MRQLFIFHSSHPILTPIFPIRMIVRQRSQAPPPESIFPSLLSAALILNKKEFAIFETAAAVLNSLNVTETLDMIQKRFFRKKLTTELLTCTVLRTASKTKWIRVL